MNGFVAAALWKNIPDETFKVLTGRTRVELEAECESLSKVRPGELMPELEGTLVDSLTEEQRRSLALARGFGNALSAPMPAVDEALAYGV